MKHTINNTEVEIDWDKVFLIEQHDSGCSQWSVQGIDKDWNEYTGDATYQDGELIEVEEIYKHEN